MPAKRSTTFTNWLEMPSLRGGYSLFQSSNNAKEVSPILPSQLAPPEEDLDQIVFGTECADPVLAPQAEQLVNQLFHILEARRRPLTTTVEGRGPFHHQRIAVRLLIGHCVALYRPLPLDNMIGIFCTKTPIEDIVLESLQLAEEMCLITYGCVPPVELSCTPTSTGNLLYIPSHLQHIMFELLKNAMRAVIEKEQHRIGTDGVINTSHLPPIVVHWDLNHEKILENVFLFHYTTAKPPTDQVNVMAGYGYGLPLSRLYARFLKGDIWLESTEGVGTNVFVQCKVNWDPEELI
ncbi:hypothetical protein HDU91_005436 [Kappamyces sp. JEL0680]|nr:hypothetical protein HDU91_005436 [Kappamyces sp. JEL0680]